MVLHTPQNLHWPGSSGWGKEAVIAKSSPLLKSVTLGHLQQYFACALKTSQFHCAKSEDHIALTLWNSQKQDPILSRRLKLHILAIISSTWCTGLGGPTEKNQCAKQGIVNSLNPCLCGKELFRNVPGSIWISPVQKWWQRHQYELQVTGDHSHRYNTRQANVLCSTVEVFLDFWMWGHQESDLFCLGLSQGMDFSILSKSIAPARRNVTGRLKQGWLFHSENWFCFKL